MGALLLATALLLLLPAEAGAQPAPTLALKIVPAAGGFDLQVRNTSTGSRIIRGPRAVGAPSFLSDIDWRVYQGGKLLDLCTFVDYVTDVRTIEPGQAISAYFDDRFVRKIYCLGDGSYEVEVRCRQPSSCREVRAVFGKRSGEK